MKKVIFIIFMLLAVAGAIWKWELIISYATTDAKKEKEQAEAEKEPVILAKKGHIRMVVEATGRVVPELEVEIKCKASGEITKLPVDVSDVVKKGDLLVQLDPEDEERLVKRAEVSLSISQARLSQAKVNLQTAESNLSAERSRAEAAMKSVEAKAQEAKSKLERVKQLVEKKIASREELEGVESANAQAMADLDSARTRVDDIKTMEAQLEFKRQEIKVAEADVSADVLSLTDAEERLKYTTVTAPIAGVVAARNVQVGQIIASGINNVGGGTTVMTIADMSRVYVIVSVDESDIGKINVGLNAQITVDAHTGTVFPGKVVRIATKGTNVSNVVTFEVKVEAKGQSRQLLRPEMTANVEIVIVEKDDALLVPVSVLERKRNTSFATIKKQDGTTEQIPVETGASDGEFMEITQGLSEGEQVMPIKKQNNNSKNEENPARSSMMKMRMMGGAVAHPPTGGGGRPSGGGAH